MVPCEDLTLPRESRNSAEPPCSGERQPRNRASSIVVSSRIKVSVHCPASIYHFHIHPLYTGPKSSSTSVITEICPQGSSPFSLSSRNAGRNSSIAQDKLRSLTPLHQAEEGQFYFRHSGARLSSRRNRGEQDMDQFLLFISRRLFAVCNQHYSTAVKCLESLELMCFANITNIFYPIRNIFS